MQTEYKTYHLERYHGRGSRHDCPECGKKFCFTYYVDEEGNIIDKRVGRCDHESSCGYHYTPKQYFQDNPTDQADRWSERPRWKAAPKQVAESPRKPDYIDGQLVTKSMSRKSTLVDYLQYLFDDEAIGRVWHDYAVGATNDMGVIYWQIDTAGMVRTGKIIHYKTDGHRDKQRLANWVHSMLKRCKAIPDTFNLVQCLFGEHLLARHPDKVVALVEAEKTALVCAMQFPDFVWVATGGKSQLSANKMAVLHGRKVVAFPDADGYNYWKGKAKELAEKGVNLNVSDYIERNATTEQKAMGVDIADLILMEHEAHGKKQLVLSDMIERNPSMKDFIEKLQLEIVG